ncbi:MAG: LTA synthase family protein [Saprospiraceae bacterium]|nr:LTA synthase family protein [Saprospiraceae bacterium]
MKNKIGLFPVFFIMFFLVGLSIWKAVFCLYNRVNDGVMPWLAGFRLDLSMASGAYLIVFVPVLFVFWKRNPITRMIVQMTSVILWIIVCVTELSSAMMFPEWGSSLDARAVSYLAYPAEAWASSRSFISLPVLLFGLLAILVGSHLLAKITDRAILDAQSTTGRAILLLFAPLAFLALRGGWQKLPIVPADAFYSQNQAHNMAATNKVWYLLYTLTRHIETSRVHSDEEIQDFIRQYKSTNAETQKKLLPSWKGKNIMILVLEGWSGSLVKYQGSKIGNTPCFDSLALRSFCFTNAFSSGFRTDQGLMSLISGIPSIASINMPNALHKYFLYPSLPKTLKTEGYSTAFYYGGDLNFANLRNYLVSMHFDTIIGENQMSSDYNITEWGVPDHLMLSEVAKGLPRLQQPFFSTALLLSSHAPFEVPGNLAANAVLTTAEKYRNSVRYSDQSLRQFFDQIKHQHWFQQTIFIIVSDHGSTHLGAEPHSQERFRIPMIIYDPSQPQLEKQRLFTTPCNHFDLPAIICGQLDISHDQFLFSRNVLASNSHLCAYWNTDQSAASFCDTSEVILASAAGFPKGHQAVLFLDWVKKWFEGQDVSAK